jgi:hypothetical protein
MRTVRSLCCTLRLLSASFAVALPSAPLVVGATALLASGLVACDDENEPSTWVKRLDDPAQRANAIKRLTQFYEDGMTKASNNAAAPEIKALLDTIIDPLTKQYTAGGLDDKTRTELIKFLAETHDPRTQPALAKALKDFEMGKTDDEVRVSCESINFMAKNGVKLDATVVTELWNVFAGFKLSKAKSERLYKALHDAVLSVHDVSYGDKAIEKLKGVATPDNVESAMDQIQWWQLTSIQVISELKYTKAVKQLTLVLLTPAKVDLNASTRMALLRMAKEAEPELIKALNGTDPDYVKAGEGFKDKANLAIVADALGLLSRPAGRDAILAALPSVDTDTARVGLAQALVQFPQNTAAEPAFLAAYKKLSWKATVDLLKDLAPRAALAQASAGFYDSGLADWLIKEIATAPDAANKLLVLESALKLMPAARKADVAAALQKIKSDPKSADMPPAVFDASKKEYDFAAAVLDKCGTTASCYASALDEPIPSADPLANFRAVKAAWMAVIYGQATADATRADLLKRVEKLKDGGARLALVEAIDDLAPKGDVAAADALDKIVAADTKANDPKLRMADDPVVKVALRLRARAAP